MSTTNGVLVFIGLVNILLLAQVGVGQAQSIDYGKALAKSLLFYEAQRSGKLPSDQRVTWRGDSGRKDGSDVGVDLVGGYHDAGDNVKLGFPMAFTVTMLAWSTLEFQSQLKGNGELDNALKAVKWGTDYFIKAHNLDAQELYGVVGNSDADHACWQRPEDMTTPRTSYKIDTRNPGSDLAGETSAALAAASILFRPTDPSYANKLLTHSKSLFEFARDHPGLYQNSITDAKKYYTSSGFQDELLWAAAWLHRATDDATYLNYLGGARDTGGTRTAFSWDDKYVGAQILVAKLVLEGKVPLKEGQLWSQYKSQAEGFLCSCLQKNSGSNVALTPGGMLWFMPWANLQYVASASFAAVVYADYLTAQKSSVTCPLGTVVPHDLINFAKSQVDYILGSNPSGMSYMVGIGSKYPAQPHHRGASIVSIKKDQTPVGCQEGYDAWYNKNSPNPNVLDGAVVGGPDQKDAYNDSRSNYQQAEPATATNAPLVGVLARLSST